MERKLKEAFNRVTASDEMSEKTWHAVQTAMYQQKPSRVHRWMSMAAAAIVFLLVVGLGGYHLYFTSTSVVSIDVNPSIEFDVNRFDKVIALNAYNDDGRALAKDLDIVHLNVEEAIDEVLANDTISELVANQADLSIAVASIGENTTQGEAILAYADECTSNHKNVHCTMVDGDNVEQAHQLGLSCGKYSAYQALLKIDPTISPQDVQQMTMREIRERLAASGGEMETVGNGRNKTCGAINNQNGHHGQHNHNASEKQ